MEDEQTLPVTPNEESLENTNGTEVPESPKETPQFITRDEWEERERQLKNEFEARIQAQQRAAQSKADKARDNAKRKQEQLLKEYVPILKNAGVIGDIDSETLGRISSQIREQEFWEQEGEGQVNETQAQPQVSYVTEAALRGYLVRRGLSANAIDISEFVGLEDTNPKGTEFYSRVEAAIANQKKSSETAAAAAKTAEARKVADVKRNYGGTATPTGSTGSSVNVSNLQTEMSDLLRKNPKDYEERVEIKNRINEIEAELKKLGQWGPQK